MCCSHHVGSTFVNHLMNCKKVCSGLLKGIRNEVNGDEKFASFKKNKRVNP